MTSAVAPDLRSLRLARRLSLVDAAIRANVSKSALSAWENGVTRPRGPALARVLDALGVEPRLRARLIHDADPAFARVELSHSPLGAPVDLGAVLRAMRARRAMTQGDLARRVGMTQSAVAHWEAGDAVPPAETLHAVAFALGATPEEALALASASGRGQAGLPDDPGEAFDRLWPGTVPSALYEVVALGIEAELWRRAARDPRWDACLVRILAERANWLVGQERWDEIAAPARRAVAMARTPEERGAAAPAVAALADLDRRSGRGHAAAAEMAGAWAERLPDNEYRSWMLFQRGMSLARMGGGDAGAALVARSTEMNARRIDWERPEDEWAYRTEAQCRARLAAGEPAQAAALVGGRREEQFPPPVYVEIEHANGRAVTDADMAHLRFFGRTWCDTPEFRRGVARLERRQAKLTGGEPAPPLPGPTDPAAGDRLWAAVLRDHRG